MKKITLSICIFLFTTVTVVAQGINRDRIRALKTAHITNALNLTSNEAEKFWPVYNAYEQNIHQLKVVRRQQINRKLRLAGGIDKITNIEADKILQELVGIESNISKENQNLYKNLKGIISSKKIIKLKWAEQSFNKELLKRLQERKFKRK